MKISSVDKEALASVKALLDSDLSTVPSIHRLCKQSGLNSDKLKKGFRIVYGCAPIAYQRQLRIKEAARLLLETEFSVQEIAWTIGFEQAPAFCKAFKKQYGVNALEWKSRHAK